MRKIKAAILLFFGILLCTQCSRKKTLSNPYSYKEIIQYYSNNSQSVASPIIVQFVEDVVNEKGIIADKSVFDIEPKVEGKLIWKQKNKLVFTPEEKFTSNKEYTASVHLDKMFSNVPDSLNNFSFKFKTIKQDLEFGGTYLSPINDSLFNVSGSIISADYINKKQLKPMINAFIANHEKTIKWNNDATEKNKFFFSIDSVKRLPNSRDLTLKLNAKSDYNISKEKKIKIPAIGDFKLVKTDVFQVNSQRIRLAFSDFIDPNQPIEGIIHTNKGKHEITIKDNYLTIDFKEYIAGPLIVTIENGFRNIKQHKLQQKEVKSLQFDPIAPGIRLIDNNTILPYGSILPFSFESVNLNAVDIKITKIYQKNILHFLQKNQLDESRRIEYVGEPVLVKKIKLSTHENLHFWNKQTIDLKSFIKKDPGALYHIEVGFRRSYSTYPCGELENKDYDPSTIGVSKDEKITAKNFWIQHDLKESYNGRERDNPCHPTYYRKDYYYSDINKFISTNILGSNLGIIAKQEKKGGFVVSVRSIKTTNALFNAKVEVFNKQNKRLGVGYTDNQGVVKLKKIENPFLVIVSHTNQKGYLKLGYHEKLHLSQFDVGGSSNRQDIKGILYAERGVWRPGDSIYVNLIVEDKFKTLPKNYPIGFEFTNPNGQMVERRTVTKSLHGHYKFWTKTDVNDITGDYEVKAYVGNNTYRKRIKVETIRPNRLKMDLTIGKTPIIYADSAIYTEINTKWLHGAPGKKLQHKINLILSNAYTYFNGYEQYRFVAPYRNFDSAEHLFLDEYTDENGKLIANKKIASYKNAPGFLKANFQIKAFEKGGRFSIDETSKIVYPYTSYVGIKTNTKRYSYQFNEAIKRSFVNLNPKGEKIDDKLLIKVYQLDYDWWYDINNNNKYVYKGQMNKKAIKTDTIITKKGVANYKFILGKEKYKEGRYLLIAENSEGHKTGEVLYFSEDTYEARPVASLNKGTKKLELVTNKKSYKQNEWIELSIPTAKTGKIFLSLEDGQQVLETRWITASKTKNTTVYRFKATHKMSPYVYANVIYVQPHQHKENDLPLRMYGVIPIKIESKNSHLKPVIVMPNELKPEKSYQIKIKESKGLPMTYTLAVVDEGLLSITKYKAPDIWENFNRKPALEIKTWDVFDRVIKADKFNVRNLLSIGGDGSGGDPEGIKLNRFKPVVKFIGPFYCAPGQTKIHKLKMPNYVGAVKVMVMAGHNKAYGKASKKVSVQNPLMVLGTMPRVLGPNEELQLPVDVFAIKKHIKNVEVTVESNDLIAFTSNKKQKLSFDKIGDKQVFFKLKTKEKFGVAKIKITAKSGKETAVYKVELAVRPSNTNRTTTFNQVLNSGIKYDQSFKSYGYKETNDLTIEVSSIPPINLKKRLDYLIHYPYGCVEQTTSSVFPQLYLSTLMNLSIKRKREIEKNINAGIERLKRFQTSDGGFSYWPGDHESHEWGTNYAGHFLLEAKEKGYKVDEDILSKWIKQQDEVATQWQQNKYANNLPQAYRLYLLAKADKPNVGAMNRLRSTIQNNGLAIWYLAASYYNIGQVSVAEDLIDKAPKLALSNTSQIETFGSNNRDNAIILLMLSELDKKEEAFKMAKSIAEELNKNKYMSTQTTAYCLLAISKYIGSKGKGEAMDFVIQSDKKEVVKTNKAIWQNSFKYDGEQPVVISNNSDKPLYFTITQNGIPKINKDTINESFGLKMKVKYTAINGMSVNPEKLEQGEDFIAEVTVKNTSDKKQKHVSLTQIFPSGWEIKNTRMNDSSTWINNVNYEDIRDDSVHMFYDINKDETITFKVFLNASYLGKYYLPAVQTEAMYNHNVRARKSGRWIEVVE